MATPELCYVRVQRSQGRRIYCPRPEDAPAHCPGPLCPHWEYEVALLGEARVDEAAELPHAQAHAAD
jgi:hypothetical protein